MDQVPIIKMRNSLIVSIQVDLSDAMGLIEDGRASGGMQAKLQAAARALSSGVTSVRIGDLSTLSDTDAGTRLILSTPSFV